MISFSLRLKAAMVAFMACLILGLNTAQAQTKTLGLTKKISGNEEDGYVLFAPIGQDTIYLINKCGQKVHTWQSPYAPGFSVYLLSNGHIVKGGVYTDTVFGAAGGRGGIIEEFDWDNNLVWRYKIFNDSLCQHHDIFPMPNGNIMVVNWHAISKSQAIALGRDPLNFANTQTELWGERLVELKPIGVDSAEIVWQWDLLDHIVQDRDTMKPSFGQIFNHPELMNINYARDLKTFDWIHANGIDYNAGLDQIIISAHNISEIWIIDHSTTTAEAKTHRGGQFDKGGDFLYRWGNPEAYKMGTSSDRKLFGQHNAQWIRNGLQDSGCILVFNNGLERDTGYSTVEVIKTPILSNGTYNSNLPYGPSGSLWKYKDSIPKNFFSQIISGAQRLPNGNTLICSGVQGRFFEVTRAGKTVWQYRNPVGPSGIQMDGAFAGNNQVFRCTFYPATYSAFKSKNLAPKGVIERVPFVYSCIYESVPPKLVKLFPKKNDTAIGLADSLQITLDEAVLKRSGNIMIFQNNQLLESVAVNSDLVRMEGKTVHIGHKTNFSLNARISVSVSTNNFRDSSFNLMAKIDTGSWYFFTIKSQPSVTSLVPANASLNNRPWTKLIVTYKEPIYKVNGGIISLYENSVLKESVAVGSSQVLVDGHRAIITPSTQFTTGSLVVVEMNACFKDTFGTLTSSMIFGDWYFRVASAPGIASLDPAKGQQDVDTNRTLIVNFDKEISVNGSGDIVLYANGKLLESIPSGDSRIAINGKVMTIDPLSSYKPASRISIQIPGNVFNDTMGLYFSGIDSMAWYFNTAAKSSIGIVSKDGLRIYPNPTHLAFNLIAEENIKCIEIYDLTGKRIPFAPPVFSGTSVFVELKGVAAGHYMVRVNGSTTAIITLE